MDISEIRFRNYQHLFERFKETTRQDDPGAPEKGMLKLFGEKLGIRQAYMSHINTRYKNIGPTAARQIEQALGLPHGWMDQAHDKKQPTRASVEGRPTQEPAAPEPTDADELAFLETAIKLYRDNPLRAQTALLQVMSSKYDK
jgi:hypothetical protein